MSGSLALRPAAPPSRPFGRPELLRAQAVLAFAVALAALTLPTSHFRPGTRAPSEPLVEPWMQVAILLVALVTGWVLWQRAIWFARRADEVRPDHSRAWYGWMTALVGLCVAAVIPLRLLAAAGRVRSDAGAGPTAAMLLVTALLLVLVGLGALRPRRRFRHAGLLPRADAPSARSVALWPAEPAPAAVTDAPRGEPLLTPVQWAKNALPPPPHPGAFIWASAVVFSPGGPSLGPTAVRAVSRRSVRTGEMSPLAMLGMTAVGLSPLILLSLMLAGVDALAVTIALLLLGIAGATRAAKPSLRRGPGSRPPTRP